MTEPSTGNVDVGILASVPSCVTFYTETEGIFVRKVTITNGCGTSQRFKTLWELAIDGDCTDLAAGASRWETRPITSRFAGLETC